MSAANLSFAPDTDATGFPPTFNGASPAAGVMSHSDDTERKTQPTEPWADAQREVEILHAGREIEAHMARYGETSDLGDLGAAHAARLRMQALIAGRSPEQIARMLQEQAERMAREPGAVRTDA